MKSDVQQKKRCMERQISGLVSAEEKKRTSSRSTEKRHHITDSSRLAVCNTTARPK